MAWIEAEAFAAVQSLARVRAVESQDGPEGLRSVWHQGAKGADLLSYVDVEGRVQRQELTLLDHYFLWTSRHGGRTGHIEADGTTVALDNENDRKRLTRMSAALASYLGDDPYIRHIREVLGLATVGQMDLTEKTVTRSRSRDDLLAAERQRLGRWVVFGATAALFAALGFAAALWLTRR